MVRSLVTLKGLTYEPSGGMVAAATTSLPEQLGGGRNWDYRYCWMRDATMTLYALLTSGYPRGGAGVAPLDAARQRRPSAAASDHVRARRRTAADRAELPWLSGYEGSRPVRIGNAAHAQLQLDVSGEILDALHVGRRYQLDASQDAWEFQKVLLEELERNG